MGLVVWSPLAQGVLTGKYNDGIPDGSRGASSDWVREDLTDAKLEKVRKLTGMAADLGLNIIELALAWVLRRPEVSCAITGATCPEHIIANVKASDVELSPSTVEEIYNIIGD